MVKLWLIHGCKGWGLAAPQDPHTGYDDGIIVGPIDDGTWKPQTQITMIVMIWVYFGLSRRTFLKAEIVSFDITKSQKACRAAWLLLWNVVRYWEQACKCLPCKFFRQHLMGLHFWLILIDFGRAPPGVYVQRDLFPTSLLPSSGLYMKLVFPSSGCRQQR